MSIIEQLGDNYRIIIAVIITLSMLLTFKIIIPILPCHRRKERCYKFMQKSENPLCSRCCSILLGMLTLIIWVLLDLNIPNPILVVVGLQVPMLIDGFTQAKKLRTSNNFLRTVTGLMSGIGLALFIYTIGFNLTL